MVGSSSKSDLENSVRGSKSHITPNREYALRSKAIEKKPSEPIPLLEVPKPVDETVDLASEDVKTTIDDVPTESLLSLPTIEEQNQMAEEKDAEDEFTEVPDVNASQGSSNFNEPITAKKPDSPPAKRAVIRTRRYTKRGRGRAK
ncbi:uncharacterized protein [Rutidosis leptorrhynchoides]|uniref:uncharacterized protein n=1 Tax=Rutidosis leptorrhynchoides TaxID=125765 RepID=UPI003A98D029